jgi:TonB-linked SusC/RagA family outer membrane protein
MFTSKDWSFERYNTRSNIDAQITPKLSLALDLSYRREQRNEPNTSINSTWTSLATAQPVWAASLPDPTIGGAYSGFSQRSPVAETDTDLSGFRDDRREYITGRISLGYDIVKGLKASAALNYFSNNTYRKSLNVPFDVFGYDNNTGDYTYQGTNGANTLNERFTKYQQLYPLISLEYDQTFGKHGIKALALAEFIDTEDFLITADRRDLLSTDIPYLFAGSPDNIQNNGSATETGRASYVGRVNYSYMGKYLLEGTFRYDASHKFPKNNRWGFFPSISAGWWLSEEGFLKGQDWLDKMKLRASYSRAGDDGVAAFRYLTGYEIREGSTATYLLENQLGRIITTTGLPNPDITWLDMTIQNVGLEMGFLNGKLGFEVDYFHRLTEGIFGTPTETYPSTFGATLPQLNINSTSDRGIDMIISHQNRVGKLNYKVAFNYGFSRRKYEKWSEDPFDDPDEQRLFQRTGNWVNRWIGYVSDGLFMTQEEIDGYSVDQDQNGNSSLRVGDIRYKDINGDGVIDFRDQDVIGDGGFPMVSYGMNISVSYNGFQLTALFQGASRFNQNIGGLRRAGFSNWSIPLQYQYDNRWQPDLNNLGVNINPNASLPPIDGSGQGATQNNNRTSDFWLQDNTYLRMKNLNLSYSLPKSLTEKVNIQNINFYVAGTNLLTWSRLGIYKDSWDPEKPGPGYPPVKTMTVGLNLTL